MFVYFSILCIKTLNGFQVQLKDGKSDNIYPCDIQYTEVMLISETCGDTRLKVVFQSLEISARAENSAWF